ncbi:hypothetical protein SGCOL_012001 [Colletotrichum sp. CLE4]
MEKVIDYRITSRPMVGNANKEAADAGRKNVHDICEDEFVHIYCGDTIFVVYREIITTGSMYFDACLFGFFKESTTQEIVLDDIEPKALELYLQLTHGWYFEIKSFGTKVVPFSLFDDLINANDPVAFKRAHLEIPKIKLKMMAQMCILCDRFIHRSLLCIVRHMFLTLLARTKKNWTTLKYEDSDWNTVHHVDFMLDYMAAFDIFSTGHDDEHLIRDAISESFYWFTRHTPSLIKHFWDIMSPTFISEWDVSRHIVWDSESEIIVGREHVRFDHAKKLFITDQLIFENSTKRQKSIRNDRVDHMCSIEDRIKLFPFVEDQELNASRIARLRALVEKVQRKGSTPYRTFIPGATVHLVTSQNNPGQRATSKKQAMNKAKNKAYHAGNGNCGGGRDRDNVVESQRNQKLIVKLLTAVIVARIAVKVTFKAMILKANLKFRSRARLKARLKFVAGVKTILRFLFQIKPTVRSTVTLKARLRTMLGIKLKAILKTMLRARPRVALKVVAEVVARVVAARDIAPAGLRTTLEKWPILKKLLAAHECIASFRSHRAFLRYGKGSQSEHYPEV